MSSKIRKALRRQDGFTLIELMTVLIILGVILGIGVPKYMQVQRQARYDADMRTLDNIIRAAETYAASINEQDTTISFSTLATAGIIEDANLGLNSEIEPSSATATGVNIDANGRVSNRPDIEKLAGDNPKDD